MARVTGHVSLRERKQGPVWYVKYRLADGRQVQKLLGPAWIERSRPPEGYYTQKTAEEALQALLADARRGTLPDSKQRSGHTFGDACDEWLRYVEHEQAARAVNGRGLPERRERLACSRSSARTRRWSRSRRSGSRHYRERLLDEGQAQPPDDPEGAGPAVRDPEARQAPRLDRQQPRRGRRAGHREAIGRLQRADPRGGPGGRAGPPRASRTRRSSRSPRSPACGSASCARCAGATSTSPSRRPRARQLHAPPARAAEVRQDPVGAADRPGRDGARRAQPPRAVHRPGRLVFCTELGEPSTTTGSANGSMSRSTRPGLATSGRATSRWCSTTCATRSARSRSRRGRCTTCRRTWGTPTSRRR